MEIYRKGKKGTGEWGYSQSVVDYSKYCHVFSRAYFKLLEIVNVIELPGTPMRIGMIAEGPGGFIQYLTHLRGYISD